MLYIGTDPQQGGAFYWNLVVTDKERAETLGDQMQLIAMFWMGMGGGIGCFVAHELFNVELKIPYREGNIGSLFGSHGLDFTQ
jgi:hypothetical protein